MTEPDDELRARLSGIDPMRPTVTPEPLSRQRAAEILEPTMLIDESTPDPTAVSPRRFRPALLAAAAALVIVAGILVSLSARGSGPAGANTLALSAPGGTVMSSCVRFDVAILRDMPVAFAGTATAVTPSAVTLQVDHWYTDGTADVVSIALPDSHSSASLDGVDFRQGTRYLVTATGGVVNGCGFSGEATPELEAAFAEAFAG